MISEVVEFLPKRFPIWIARIIGGIACAFATVALGVAIGSRHEILIAGLFGILGFWGAVFGAWMLSHAARLGKLHAVFGPSTLRLVAPLWRRRGLTVSEIPWAAVDGFADVTIFKPSWPRGAQTICVLYTRRGEFMFDENHWNNLMEFRREIAARAGSLSDRVASARSAIQDGIQSDQRRLYSIQRLVGRVVAAISAPLFLAAFAGGIELGFSHDLYRGLIFLFFAFSLGVSMVRFYHRDGCLPVRRARGSAK